MEKLEQCLYNQWAKLFKEGNIVHLIYFNGIVLNLEGAERMCKDRITLANFNPHYMFADCRGVKYWTKEARAFNNTDQNNSLIKAAAVIYTNSHVINILLNFYLKFNKVPYPVKFFTSAKEGLNWLSGMEAEDA